jgi:Repeat of unknown function (DUF5648)
MKLRVNLFAATLAMASLITACGQGGIETATQATDKSKISEKAPGDKEPVFRFAKISTGAYFYTANATEAEEINKSYPDFRYEGVAFQHVTATGGGIPVYRFAKLDSGGYFYTANEVEKNFVESTLSATFRFEGISFYAVSSGGQPVYRLSNSNNGAYLYTTSPEEYNYAGSLTGWRQEGTAFNAPSGLQISGTVSDGTPWAQANVRVVDKNGVVRTATTSTIGTYFIDAAGLVAPVQAIATTASPGPVGDFMKAVLPSLPSGTTSTTMNLTPLTNLVALYSIDSTDSVVENMLFPQNWNSAADITARYSVATTAVRTSLAAHLNSNGIPAATFDSVKLPFAANNSGQAAVVRDVAVTFTGNGAWFTNRLSGDPASSSVYVTEGNINSAPVLALGTKPVFPQAQLDGLKNAWKACLAVPAASRISLDANDNITAVHPTCAAIAAANYNSSGETFANRNKTVLRSDTFSAASVKDVKFRNYSDIDGKEIAGAYVHMLSSDNHPVNQLEIFNKQSGAWVLSGNQRIYDGAISSRQETFTRRVYGTTSTYLEQDSTRLTLAFNPAHPSMATIRAVRVTGPGLPVAGVVLARSNSCGTETFMTIANKTGAVIDSVTSANILFSSSGTPNFTISRLVRGGTNTWPAAGTVREFGDVNLVSPGAEIAPFAKYVVQLFDFTANSSAPIATFTTNLNGTVRNPFTQDAFLVKPSVSFVSDWLLPTGAKAGAQSSVDYSWDSKLLFQPQMARLTSYSSSRNLAQSNTAAADYFFKAPSFEPIRIPDNVFTITKPYAANSLFTGVSTNATVAAFPAAQNTSCALQPSQLRAITAAGDYREFSFRSAASDLTVFQHTEALQN